METTALRIRTLRDAKKLSQKELGELIGRVKNTIYNYENDLQSPTEKDLRAIAAALDTTVAYLVGDIDDPSPNALKANELDALLIELGKADPEIVAMFRDTSQNWEDYSDKEKKVIIAGLRFVFGRADVDKQLKDIHDEI